MPVFIGTLLLKDRDYGNSVARASSALKIDEKNIFLRFKNDNISTILFRTKVA